MQPRRDVAMREEASEQMRQARPESVRAAVLFTLAQHGAFFASAWLVSAWAGAQLLGAWSQALALATVLGALAPLRLEYAAQLQAQGPRAQALFGLARRAAALLGLVAAVLAALAAWAGAPLWLAAGALAVAPLALTQIRASAHARADRPASAAAVRALPALLMVPLQLLACLLEQPQAVAWSVAGAAWLAWLLQRRFAHAQPPRAPGQPLAAAHPLRQGWQRPLQRRALRRLRTHWRFVRTEWLGLALNSVANHGQVLVVGALAGDAAAGTLALGLRIAMLPTSLVGLAWADRLRARVVAGARQGLARGVVVAGLARMAALSVPLHAALALLAALVLPWIFVAQGRELLWVVWLLLPLGAVRLVASPVAFVPAWRGWLGLSLALQALLCAAALLAALLGAPWSGVAGVAGLYTAVAALVYGAYIALALRGTA